MFGYYFVFGHQNQPIPGDYSGLDYLDVPFTVNHLCIKEQEFKFRGI